MRIIFNHYLIIVLSSVFISACSPDFLAMAERRVEIARLNTGEIKIVAIQSLKNSNYINGVLLAAKQINQRPNKLINRPLKIQVERDAQNFNSSRYMIERVVSDPRVTAVLGHRTTSMSVPASAIYERSKVIFQPSFATGKVLTGHNFKYTFRMAPNSTVMGQQIAFAAKTLGYKKIAIFYGRDELSKEEAFLFESAAIKLDIDIITQISFFSKSSNYRPKISLLSDQEFDAIFISSRAKSAGRLTRQLREMGMNQPILGNDSFAQPNYIKAAGETTNNIIIPTIYNVEANTQINKKFRKSYMQLYHSEPDENSAQGYDSLMLIANAIEKSGSTLPSVLVSTLHYMPAWVGLTGIHAFNDYGEIRGKKYLFKVRKGGQWHNLSSLDVPYSLYQFRQRQIEKYKLSDTDITDFLEVFKKRMHIDDRKGYLIDLAHEILRFKKIGIIYEDTAEGQKAADYGILKSIAERKNFEIVSCKIPFSILSKKKIKIELIACYGKLPLESSAFYINPYNRINKKFIQVLNKNLAFFKIPTVSIETDEVNPYVSLSLGSFNNLSEDNIKNMNIYSDILAGLKVHEFSEILQGLPEIIVNLQHIQDFNLSETAIIKLSPNTYSHLVDSYHKKGE